MHKDQEYMEFYIARALAGDKLSEMRVYLRDEDNMKRDLYRSGLHDSQVLFRMIVKDVNEHNSKLLKKKTQLDNLNYQRSNWRQSKLFSGLKLPWKAIAKIVRDNPDCNEPYDLYRKLSRD